MTIVENQKNDNLKQNRINGFIRAYNSIRKKYDTNKNMGLYDKTFPPENLTNIMYTNKMTYDDYLYIDSRKEKTIIKGSPSIFSIFSSYE